MTEYTPKAQQTRQLILNTALDLFIRKGYEAATMREIAAEAKVSLGLAYRYFDSKEALVLSLYQQMAAETDNVVEKLPAGTVAQRFWLTMTTRLEQNLPYRDAFGALFGTMMTPKSN
ncbi:MAG: TetR family transcriptional regulator [Chloroflexi bacterium OLB15]|nr:MAG: TetR family transcriptional regulator [Chloroflexi bacterium OLB15]